MSIACISNKIRHIAMAVGPDPLESSIAEIIKQKKESIIKQAEIAIDRLIKTKKVHYIEHKGLEDHLGFYDEIPEKTPFIVTGALPAIPVITEEEAKKLVKEYIPQEEVKKYKKDGYTYVKMIDKITEKTWWKEGGSIQKVFENIYEAIEKRYEHQGWEKSIVKEWPTNYRAGFIILWSALASKDLTPEEYNKTSMALGPNPLLSIITKVIKRDKLETIKMVEKTIDHYLQSKLLHYVPAKEVEEDYDHFPKNTPLLHAIDVPTGSLLNDRQINEITNEAFSKDELKDWKKKGYSPQMLVYWEIDKSNNKENGPTEKALQEILHEVEKRYENSGWDKAVIEWNRSESSNASLSLNVFLASKDLPATTAEYGSKGKRLGPAYPNR